MGLAEAIATDKKKPGRVTYHFSVTPEVSANFLSRLSGLGVDLKKKGAVSRQLASIVKRIADTGGV